MLFDDVLYQCQSESGTACLIATHPSAEHSFPTADSDSQAAAIVRSEPDALVRSATGYTREARSHGTRRAYEIRETRFVDEGLDALDRMLELDRVIARTLTQRTAAEMLSMSERLTPSTA